MILRSWTSRDRTVLLAGGSAIALMLGTRIAVPKAIDWVSVRRADATSVLRRSALLADEQHLYGPTRDSLAARRIRFAVFDSALIAASSVPEAGAALAGLLADLADQESVRIVSMQVRPDSASATRVTRVAVRATGVADVAGLTALLRDIDDGAALMVVRELAVTQAEPAQADAKPETLRFEVLVEALAVIQPRKAADSALAVTR